ncbi:uncharacterized protein LOC125370295 [Ricinus communis]|uniref:uncharacterized protein LOC125370295 n=1 Tax=Ricinus communis TaxID=3988 RepID=UPI00201AB0B6|nr:uncharacterized protein LOC125370295 [Ricinus communis]
MAKNKFHPALVVKNFIHVTLEMEKGHNSSWVELFKIHCRAYQVIDHIFPPTQRTTETAKEKAVARDEELWSFLNAIVLQWIYDTILNDFLQTILELDSTAQQNSKCLHQLSNVGAPVSNQWLVLQLSTDLNENYDGVGTFIQQSNLLPPFYEARSRLILEKARKAKQTAANASATGTALLNANSSVTTLLSANSSGTTLLSANNSVNESKGSYFGLGNATNRHHNNQKRGQHRTNNRGKNNGGRGRSRGGHNHASSGTHTQPSQQRMWQQQPQQPPPAHQPDILNNRPQQAYTASVPPPSNYAPTEIE